MPSFSRMTTGTALFALDSTLMLAVWPATLWAARTNMVELFELPSDPRGFIYPIFGLLLLFAMGLYRRDAILELGRSFTRVPLVVGMGATLSVLFCLALPWLGVRVEFVGGADQAALFAVATVAFTLCAWCARLVLNLLLRGRVLRRRLLIIGAGQRTWDLLLMLGREGGSLHDDVTLLHRKRRSDALV
jgi:hypothetical protein